MPIFSKKDIIPTGRGLTDDEKKVFDAIVKDEVSESGIKTIVATPEPAVVPEPEPEIVIPKVEVGGKHHPGDGFEISKLVSSGPGWSVIETPDRGRLRLSGGTLAWRNNNPGNLKYGSFASENGAIGKDYKGFAVFKTLKDGKKAHKTLLFAPGSRYYNKSLTDAIALYAPAADNNKPKTYANFIAKKAGINRDWLMSRFSDAQQDAIIDAMEIYEGYKQGTVTQQ